MVGGKFTNSGGGGGGIPLPDFTYAIDSIDDLVLTSTEIITTGNNAYGSLLFNVNGELMVHSSNKAWLYTAVEAGGTWTTYAQEFDLDTHSVGSGTQVKPLDAGREWSVAHLVINVAPNLYVMFYTSNATGGANRYVRAATCAIPNGTFVRDTGFEIQPSETWEGFLESWPGWVKLTEDAIAVTGYIGYASYTGTPGLQMGWAEVSIDKATGITTLVGKKSTNPMAHLAIANHTGAYNGGVLDSRIRFNGHYPIFYYVTGGDGIAYAESTSPTHESGDLVQEKFFQNPAGSFDEIFSFYVWNGKLYLICEGNSGSEWVTYLFTYLNGG